MTTDRARRTAAAVAALAAVATLAAACGEDTGDDGAGATTTPSTTPTSPPSSTPETSTPSVPPSLVTVSPSPPTTGRQPRPGAPTPAVETAVADLAERLGADPATIAVVSEEEVTWPDGSLGCPEPGLLYPQVLTDGVRIVLDWDGTRYEYHGEGGPNVFFCEDPQPAVGE